MKALFINGSPNKNGNTAALAQALLGNHEYGTLNLTDYKIYSYGQNFEEDELGKVIAKMKEAGEYTMKRFAGLYGMKYEGMATNKTEALKLAQNL